MLSTFRINYNSSQQQQHSRDRGIPVDRIAVVVVLLGGRLRRADRVGPAVAVIGVRRYHPARGLLRFRLVVHRREVLQVDSFFFSSKWDDN